MSRARGRHRERPYRKRGEQLELDRAFSEAWAQRAWDSRRHETPAGICFADTSEWRAWLHRAQESYPDMDLLTLSSVAPIVLVFFQRPGGEWLDAGLIDQLVLLARSRRAARALTA